MRYARAMLDTVNVLSPEQLRTIDAYWRAANYLSVGQIYLLRQPALARTAAARAHQAAFARSLGHDAGPQLHVRAHEPRHHRARSQRDLHRGARSRRPRNRGQHVSRRHVQRILCRCSANEDGLKRLFRQFSFPGGIPSHVAPETPGSIHEGGELGYALLHAFGAAFDNPDLIVALRRRRRRGGDGSAGGKLALQQISRIRCATARCCRSSTSTDTRSRVPPFSRGCPRGTHRLLRGYGYQPLLRRRRRSRRDAPADGAHARRRADEIRAIQRRRARRRRPRAARLADDRAAHAQRLDGPEVRRRPADRGHFRAPPGPADELRHESRTPRDARSVDAQLPARGALRRRTDADRRKSPSCRRAANGA